MGRTKLFITKRIGPMDFPLMITTLLLVLIGVVAVFSASFYSSISESGSPYGFAIKQVVFAIIGLICMILSTKMNYHVWRTFSIPILGISFFLLFIVKSQYCEGSFTYYHMSRARLLFNNEATEPLCCSDSCCYRNVHVNSGGS